eukprot:5821958-Ditylum_brightwellii.AAC.1
MQIQYKSILNIHKTLSHYKAPAGTIRVQATVLADRDAQYACRVTKSSLTRHDAWIYYNSCYQKSMGYALGQSFFFKYVQDNICQKALRAFTAKCRYNRNMAYALHDGPSHLGG